MKQKAIRTNEKTIAILGGGCAGWSLAAKAEQLSAKSVTLYLKEEMRPSHSWGFWQMPWLSDAVLSKRSKWNSWQIITEEGTVNHNSIKHAYHNLKSDDWFNWCRNQFLQANTKTKIIKLPVINTEGNHIITSEHKKTFDCIYDSRSPKAEKNILFQHFKGIEIKTTNPVFNPEVATLMDFRVSQKNGIHFMYVLGYDAFTALVESTFFSPSPHSEEIYDEAIKDYLERFYDLYNFEIIHSEMGVIPMGDVKPLDSNPFLHKIGSNAGAVRPSSGYAFSFIQKQIMNFLNNQSKPCSPHTKFDLWMDKIFLEVLRTNPRRAPSLFFRMAKALDGDSFARFLSGEAKIWDYIFVISSMPKWLFLKCTFKVMFKKRKG